MKNKKAEEIINLPESCKQNPSTNKNSLKIIMGKKQAF